MSPGLSVWTGGLTHGQFCYDANFVRCEEVRMFAVELVTKTINKNSKLNLK